MSGWGSGLPLPGADEAEALGYSLFSHFGNHHQATYDKSGIFLDVWYSLDGVLGRLSFVHRALVVTTGDFSFPNKNFSHFEKRIARAKQALKDDDEKGELF